MFLDFFSCFKVFFQVHHLIKYSHSYTQNFVIWNTTRFKFVARHCRDVIFLLSIDLNSMPTMHFIPSKNSGRNHSQIMKTFFWIQWKKHNLCMRNLQTSICLIGSLSQTFAYTMISPAPPFPVMCLAYVFNGFGIALQDAQANGYVACLKENASAKMGLLHAVYGLCLRVYALNTKWRFVGLGALSSPLVATQFAQLPRWSFHYLVSLGIAATNTLVLVAVFRGKTQDGESFLTYNFISDMNDIHFKNVSELLGMSYLNQVKVMTANIVKYYDREWCICLLSLD